MTCSTCERLQREKAELVDELEAWRDHDRREAESVRASQEVVDWKAAFALTGQGARLLLALVKLEGRLLTLARGHALLASLSDYEPNTRIVSVYICKIRKALRACGIEGAVVTHWGEGWSIAPGMIAVLKARAERRAAG